MKHLILIVCLSGCYTRTVTGRFRDQPVVEQIDDRRPIAEPRERVFYTTVYIAHVLLLRPILDTLDPPASGPALDINAMEEVPDSTWFENRIGRGELTPDAAARGPGLFGAPVGPYSVVGGKPSGNNPGFIIKDSRGLRYLVKFDTRENPEQQTATDAIVGRLFWALGYHVPAEHVFHFKSEELVLSREVVAKGVLYASALARTMATATRRADGTYRASASQLLEGVAKGGWKTRGMRSDDPNDRVPHQRRRVLRGLRVFAAWLSHTDLQEDNTLDVYGGPPGRQHLRHYLIDFGEAFGGHQSEKGQIQIGWEYAWDYGNQLKALFAFGLWKRAWESQKPTPWPSVGYFSADHFDPETWHERYPYPIFNQADPADAYWAARLIMRFDRPLLEAVVATAQLTDPAAARYLVDTLLARRAKIGAAYLDGVTPLEQLELRDGRLCGVDVARMYGVARDGAIVVANRAFTMPPDGKFCVPLPLEPGYHLLRIYIRRTNGKTPPLELHYQGGPNARVLGIVR
ncbi:MAG: hypothetical protein WKG01_14165 [Kofleriaceae bacterium]